VTKPEDVRGAIEEAISIKGPVFIDFIVEREENVWPMVAPGAPLYDMMEG
jgi:acetolactate synthase-1/2/3 large subunit